MVLSLEVHPTSVLKTGTPAPVESENVANNVKYLGNGARLDVS